MDITIETFKEEYLPPLTEKFLENTKNYIMENQQSIYDRLRKQTVNLFRFVANLQQEKPVIIGELQISMLYSSVVLGKPEICFSFYDDAGILGKEIITVKYKMDWLFTAWEDFEKSITDKVRELKAEQSIRYEGVKQLMLGVLRNMPKIFYANLKYFYREVYSWDYFDELVVTPDFKISIGEYRDWSRDVYMERTEADLMVTDKKDYSFYSFVGKMYTDCVFRELDLTSTRFLSCSFMNCKFVNCTLNDSVFFNSKIQRCQFEHVTFYGAMFVTSLIRNNKCVETELIYNPYQDGSDDLKEELEDFYHDVAFAQCTDDGTIC